MQSAADKWYNEDMTYPEEEVDSLAAPAWSVSDDDEEESLEDILNPPPPEPRPDISQLPDALVAGKPAFGVGDKIIIERTISVLKKGGYLDTKSYKVASVDHSTGNLRLWDESLGQWAMDNYIEGPKAGYIYKMANGILPMMVKGKRGRPRKNPVAPKEAPLTDSDGNPIKKKRGRPPGTKNRPSEVVKAEKAAKKAERAQKRAFRAAKAPAGRRASTGCKAG